MSEAKTKLEIGRDKIRSSQSAIRNSEMSEAKTKLEIAHDKIRNPKFAILR